MYKTIVLLVLGSLITINTETHNKTLTMKSSNQTKQDTMSIEEYGEKIAGLLLEKDWEGIVDEVYPVHVPDDWQEMVKPFFAEGFGQELNVEVFPFEALPDHQLHWLKKAPEEILNRTKKAIRLSYDHSTLDATDKGKLELAVYEHEDGSFSILLVGDE